MKCIARPCSPLQISGGQTNFAIFPFSLTCFIIFYLHLLVKKRGNAPKMHYIHSNPHSFYGCMLSGSQSSPTSPPPAFVRYMMLVHLAPCSPFSLVVYRHRAKIKSGVNDIQWCLHVLDSYILVLVSQHFV